MELPHQDTYVVEKILNHRIRNGRHQWLVKWQGYDDSMNTWEPANAFVGDIQKDWIDYNRKRGVVIDLSILI